MRRLLQRTGFVLASVVLTLALIEVAARLLGVFPPRSLSWLATPTWNRPLAEAGVRLWTPNIVFGNDNDEGEFDVQVHINARGMHDIDHELTKPDGVYRVLVLGDSFVDATEVELEQTLVRRLQAALAERLAGNPEVEVINGGHKAFGTSHELLYFRYEGTLFDPDAVVLMLYADNDLTDNGCDLPPTHLPRPCFTLAANDLHMTVQPDPAGEMKEASRGDSLSGFLYRNLFTYRLLRDSIGNWVAPRSEEPERAPAIPEPAEGFPLSFSAYLEDSEALTEAWDLLEALLLQLKQDVEASGAQLAIVTIPPRREVVQSEWDAVLSQYPELAAQDPNRDLPHQRLREVVERVGVPYLELAETFGAYDRPEALYFAADKHFTPLGNEVAADAIASFLLNRWLKPENR